MVTGEAVHTEFFADSVESSAGAAVSVAHEDPLVPVGGRPDARGHGVGDDVRAVVKRGGQTLNVDVGQAVGLHHLEQLACECATGDDEGPPAGCHGGTGGLVHRRVQAAVARRSATRRLAVSAATAASRQ